MTKLGPYEVHPFADKFLLIEGEAFDKLVADIKQNGLQNPITVNQDQTILIDGRNRYRACIEAGVKPKLNVLGSHYTEERILNLIVSENVHRRHLNAGQLAVIAMEYEQAFAKAKKESEIARRSKFPLDKKDNSGVTTAELRESQPNMSELSGTAAAQAAKIVGASERYVQLAKAVNRDAPELIEKVQKGEISLDAADKQRKKIVQGHTPETKKETKQDSGKITKKESDRILKEQTSSLEDWTFKLESLGMSSIFERRSYTGLHESITIDDRQKWSERLRKSRTAISRAIKELED